jgi:hypothetical protein
MNTPYFETHRGKKLFLGKSPARFGAVKFRLRDYLDLPRIEAPRIWGHITNTIDWGELGNNKAGCCVVSGAGHEHMLWTRASRRKMAPFSEVMTLADYKEVTNWDGVTDSASDTGLDMQQYASHRRRVGVRDANGEYHKIHAYAAVSNIENTIKAGWAFGAVGMGVRFPASAGAQFDRQQVWEYTQGSDVLGGHYIPLVGVNSRGLPVCVTWGRLQAMSMEWMEHYLDEVVAYIPHPDYVDPATNLTPEMFDMTKLEQALQTLA